MTYDEFKNEVMENIKEYLPKKYKDFDMEIKPVIKEGIEYDGLLISERVEGASSAPVLNLTAAYKDYEKGKPFEEVIKRLAKIRTSAKLPKFNLPDIMILDKVKDMIIPRLINRENNEEYLVGKPFTCMEDLAITYVVRIPEEDGFGDAVVNDGLLKSWDIDKEELHKIAMENLEKSSYIFQPLIEVMMGIENDGVIEDIEIEDCEDLYFILSNKHKTRGATMAINAPLMNRIVKQFKGIYVIPSSVDEVIIIPKNCGRSVEELVRMVTHINEREVPPENRLSNNVYEWDTDTSSLKIAV